MWPVDIGYAEWTKNRDFSTRRLDKIENCFGHTLLHSLRGARNTFYVFLQLVGVGSQKILPAIELYRSNIFLSRDVSLGLDRKCLNVQSARKLLFIYPCQHRHKALS